MINVEEVWQRRTDEQVAEAAVHLQEYSAEARGAILAELARRGIPDPTQVVLANQVTVTAQATSKECPKCGLFNPGIAERCDCGFDFLTNRVGVSYARPTDQNIRAELGMTVTEVGRRNIEIGATVSIIGIVGGLALAIATQALSGGFLVLIWWGGTALGLANLFRGIRQYQRGKRIHH